MILSANVCVVGVSDLHAKRFLFVDANLFPEFSREVLKTIFRRKYKSASERSCHPSVSDAYLNFNAGAVCK